MIKTYVTNAEVFCVAIKTYRILNIWNVYFVYASTSQEPHTIQNHVDTLSFILAI